MLHEDGRSMLDYLDSELVERAQQGEGYAFDILVKRYQSKVTQLVYRYVRDTDTALDLVQDIFFKIFKNLVKFKGESKFSSWLFRVAINDCIDHIRRVKVRKEQSLDSFQQTGFDIADNHESNAQATFEAEDEYQRIKEALDNLPATQKTVVVMKIYQDMTFDQIAEILDEPVSTIKSRLYKALSSLGSIMRQRKFIEGGKL